MKAYFATRLATIRKLMKWMPNSKRPYPLNDFVLPEWRATQSGSRNMRPIGVLDEQRFLIDDP